MITFPSSWQFDEAKKVCVELVDCINKTAPTVSYETPYKMIRTTNVKNGRVELDDTRFVDEATFIKWNRRLTPKNRDIVLTREAPLGDVGLIRSNDQVFLGQRTMLFRANPELMDQHFLYYSLLGPTVQAQIKTFGSGSTVEHVRVPDAEKITIPYPELQSQRKIAAILTTYDDLVETNKRRIAVLEKMAEELYHEWFVRMRFPGYENSKFVRGAPEEWPVDLGSTFFDLIKGKSYSSHEISDEEGSCFFITLKSFNRRGGYRKDGLKYFSGPYKEEQCVATGDVVMAVTDMTQDRAVVGEVARIPSLPGKKSVISLDVIRLIPKDMSNTFLYAYMRHSGFANYIKEFANGANVLHLKPDLVGKQRLLFPPKNLRDRFSVLAEPIYNEVDGLEEANAVMAETRDLLLPRLICGKLPVGDLHIQFPPSMQKESAKPEAAHA